MDKSIIIILIALLSIVVLSGCNTEPKIIQFSVVLEETENGTLVAKNSSARFVKEGEPLTIVKTTKTLIGTGDNSELIKSHCDWDNFTLGMEYANGTTRIITDRKECYRFFDELYNGWQKELLGDIWVSGNKRPT